MAALKVYMPLPDQQTGLAAYKQTLKRLGITAVSTPSGVDGVLLTSDRSAIATAGHANYMSKEAVDIVLTRDRLGETGLPVLPTTVVASPEDAPSGMFVKTRHSVTGGYVYQPHIGFPHKDLDIHFSVNASGDVHVIAAQRNEFFAAQKQGVLRMATPDEYVGVVEQIEAACKRLGVKGGLHDIAFLQYEGQWCATDWNPRAPFLYTEGVAANYPCLDNALLHMLGQPLQDIPAPVFANRPYWDTPIPLSKRFVIESIGLTPRRDPARKIEGFVRVNGVGATEQEVINKFNQMENLL